MKHKADGRAAYPYAERGGILATPPWCVRQLAMSLSRFAQPRGLHVEVGVHVRLTESLNTSCNLHLELSGSRAKPTAALRGVIFLLRAPLAGRSAAQAPRPAGRKLAVKPASYPA
jgi:hypothetical protein